MKIAVTILGTIFLIAVLLGGYYLFRSGTIPLEESPSPSPISLSPSPRTQSSPPITPGDWIPYVSETHGFTLKHPADMTVESRPEGERFFRLGPTQSTGTELYDGISLLINSGELNGQSLMQLAQSKQEEMANEETTNSITDVTSKSYGPHTAYQFRKSSLGEGDFIYIQKSPTEYLELVNLTVQPADQGQTYMQITEQMISSLEF